MSDFNNRQELAERLNLIETMLAEGRRKTERWGWTFVLWGVAYGGAIVGSNVGYPFALWSIWGHHSLAWPIAVASALVTMFVIIAVSGRREEKQPETVLGRSAFSVWIALAVSMPLLLAALASSGRLDQQGFVAIVCTLLGTTNAASSMILKWRLQFVCAVIWWVAAVSACFSSVPVCLMIFLAAIFLCQIVFGLYGMAAEARGQKQVMHA
jgi:hypothetical protein